MKQHAKMVKYQFARRKNYIANNASSICCNACIFFLSPPLELLPNCITSRFHVINKYCCTNSNMLKLFTVQQPKNEEKSVHKFSAIEYTVVTTKI